MTQDITNDMLKNIFQTLQRINNNRSPNKPNNNNKYPIRNELIFGEELDGYFESFENVHHAIMEKDPLYPVKEMTQRITMEFYEGEAKHVDYVAGIYGELVKARLSKGLKGMKGFNMKGVIVSILYMIMSFEFKSRLDIKKLLKAANKVRSSTATKITSKMVFRYIKTILDNLRQYNTTVNSNNNNNDISIEQELKRVAMKAGYSTKQIFEIKRLAKKVPELVKKSHHPHSIAAAIVFVYMTEMNDVTKKQSEKNTGISKYAVNKIVPKVRKAFGVSVSIKIS